MSKFVVNVRHHDVKYDVYVGRPSKWGNPFLMPRDGNREQVVEKYRIWINTNDELRGQIVKELRGKVLGCWCAPQACHADILAEIANALEPYDFGDRMTIKEFFESGMFTPDDGIGYYGMSHVFDRDCVVFRDKPKPEYTHVHWYNK